MDTPIANPLPPLSLNAAPLEVPAGSKVKAEELPYLEGSALDALRATHRDTHVIRRSRESLLALPISSTAPPLGGKPLEIELDRAAGLVCFLWKEALIRRLATRGSTLTRFRPLGIVSKARNDSLVPPDLAPIVDVRVNYEIETRVLRPPSPAKANDRDYLPSVVVGVHVARRVIETCHALHQRGIDLRGLWVGDDRQPRDERFGVEFNLRGKVRSLDGSSAIVDGGQGSVTVATESIRPEGSSDTLERIVHRIFGRRSDQILEDIAKRVAAVHIGPELEQRIDHAIDLLAPEIEIAPGVLAKMGRRLSPSRWPSGTSSVCVAKPPTYIFDATRRKTANKSSDGIERWGPLSRFAAIPRSPRLCIICQGTQQGRAEQFAQKFLHGITGTVYESGFLRTYGLESCVPAVFTAKNASASAYREATQRAIEAATERNEKWDLALVMLEERTHELVGDENPYLVTKALFLTSQVPVQEFTFETARAYDSSLAWSLGNMALACYAKLGGQPWALAADPTITHELVVGLSSTSLRENRLGPGERLVGITTVFSGEGQYYLHNLSRAVPFKEYSGEMLSTLRKALTRIKTDRNWQPGERVRIVFHAFKPLKNAEADAVKELTKELTDFDLEFAFAHVIEASPFLLFDPTSSGYSNRHSPQQTNRGKYVPQRGLIVELANGEVAITTTGPQQLKRGEDGMPRPIVLRLHEASTFTDVKYLAEQALLFSAHSWRGFMTTSMPVTIVYSHSMAQLMAKLGTTSRWNPDVLLNRIGTTPWFL